VVEPGLSLRQTAIRDDEAEGTVTDIIPKYIFFHSYMKFKCVFRMAWWIFTFAIVIVLLIQGLTGWGLPRDPIVGKPYYNPFMAAMGWMFFASLVEIFTREDCVPKVRVVKTPSGKIDVIYEYPEERKRK
jgi:hypothetical protein